MKIKKAIKKIFPLWLLRWRQSRNKSIFKSMTTKEVFLEIYNTNYWKSKESISGVGSELNQTKSLIRNLETLMSDMKIESVLVIPCGDFNWMKKVDLSKIDYIGADIVDELISTNIKNQNGRENLKFKVLDLTCDPLPKSDLLIVRDCLVHLSYQDIYSAITNIKSSGSKYLLTTTFTDNYLNMDIVTGDWRPLNLQDKPFNFPSPILIINENCTEDGGEYSDKSMALWDISKL